MRVKFVLCRGYLREDDIVEIVEFKDDETNENIDQEHCNWLSDQVENYWEKLND